MPKPKKKKEKLSLCENKNGTPKLKANKSNNTKP